METLSKLDYEKLLELPEHWRVEEVLLHPDRINIDVEYEHTEGEYPECGNCCSVYDYRTSRKWRHLDTMQYKTYIRCRLPRLRCDQCKKTLTISIPWSESRNGFTFLGSSA